MPKSHHSKSNVFGSAELTILEGAVADAWEILSSQKHHPGWAVSHEEVARAVMAIAAEGERDKAKLTRLAIECVIAETNGR